MRSVGILLVVSFLAAACGGGQETPTASSAFLSGDEDRYFNLALQERRAGNLSAAEEALVLALEANPRYLAAHLAMGDVEYALDNYSAAIESYLTAIGLRERTVEGHFGLARAYNATHQLDDARYHAERAYALAVDYGTDETQSRTLTLLGAIEMRLEDWEAAEETLERSLDLDSSNIGARMELARLKANTGRLREAVSTLSGVERFEEDPELLLAMGAFFYEFRVFERAVQVFERGNEVAPDDQEIAYYLAASYMKTGNPELAISIASQVIQDDPGYLDAYVVRGRGELLRAQSASDGSTSSYVQRARDDAEYVLAANPSHYDALILMGSVLREEAAAALGSTAFEPDASVVARAETRAADRLREAEERLVAAVAVDPNGIEGIDELGGLLFEQERFAEFVDLVGPQLDRQEREERWRSMMVTGLLETGRPGEAVAIQSALADEHVNDAELNRDVARLALDTADQPLSPEKIHEHAQRAYQNSARSMDYVLLLFDSFLNIGDYDEAEERLDIALQAWPNHPDVRAREDTQCKVYEQPSAK